MSTPGDGFNQPEQEFPRNSGRRLRMQFHESKLRGAIDGDEHMQLALFGAHLGHIDMEVTDRVAPEGLLHWAVALDSGQPAYAMARRQRCSDERVRCGMVGCSA